MGARRVCSPCALLSAHVELPTKPSALAKNAVGEDAPVWVLDLDVIGIRALRDANPEYVFFVLPM